MKKFILSFILLMLMLTSVVNANSIKSITMDIYIDGSGDAQVTEIWDCTTNQGTESYHPYYNLGESEITNLQVKDEDGVTYTPVSYWNVNSSFENKKYKCGINEISDGVELCWGISEYGNKTYTVNYEISNFVLNLTDSQMVYWTLMPHNFSNTIGAMEITIRADEKFEDTLDVWGYGEYGAPAYVRDGVVRLNSKGRLKKDEYKVLLIKFPTGIFNTDVSLNNNFEYYLNMAEEGSVKYVDKSKIIKNIFLGFLKVFSILAWIVIYASPFIIVAIVIFIKNSKFEQVAITREQKKMIKEAPYYRDIPCDKQLFKIFYIAFSTGLMKKKTDVLGVLILKWLKEKKVTLQKEKDTVIVLNKEIACEVFDEYEKDIYWMMYEASKNGVLEKKELETWCRDHCKEILAWLDNVLAMEKLWLLRENSIYVAIEGKLLKKKRIYFTDNLIQEVINISGLKKYLNDYTLIDKREAIEVELFEEYLMFAQLVGIADKVVKELKNIYPEVIEVSSYQIYDDFIFFNELMNDAITSAHSAKHILEFDTFFSIVEIFFSSDSESSSSSGGGGHGSFGGGSRGGGGFR